MRSVLLSHLLIGAALALLGGCDGRGGSSGLDVSSENATIKSALARQRCLDFEDLRICPARESVVETPTPGASTVTPGTMPSVETGLNSASAVDCFQEIGGGSCTINFRFLPRSFPFGTTFKTLVRVGATGSPWVLGAEPVPVGNAGEVYDAVLVAASATGRPPEVVQLAILAFAAPSISAASEVQELHQTAATFAFVTEVLAVNLVTPTPTVTPTHRPTTTPPPTRTPGASDCCQCSSSCAAPVDGMCDDDCTVVFGTSCFAEQLCVVLTPTPTATPTPTEAPCQHDNGDGTVRDECTGLIWEKKDLAGGIHDFSAYYPWAGTCEGAIQPPRARTPSSGPDLCQPDASAAATCAGATNNANGCAQCASGTCRLRAVSGLDSSPTTTVWGWLAALNEQGFAGHSDWRIPTVGEGGDAAELETIALPTCTAGIACVSAAFNSNCEPGAPCSETHPCGAGQRCVQRPERPEEVCQDTPGCTLTECSCTWPQYHWSATSDPASEPQSRYARTVDFSTGEIVTLSKLSGIRVRAVRGRTSGTPTPIPDRNDCCQCESSCSQPVDGSCGSCTLVSGAACDAEHFCAPHSPTPTPTPCLHDNGDGTITDGCHSLMWEKKDRADGINDYGALYTWAGVCMGGGSLCQPNAEAAAACRMHAGDVDGCAECPAGTCIVDPYHTGAATTIWKWITQLNAAGFAGYDDWRIPNIGVEGHRPELETILAAPYPCTGHSIPCVPDVFNSQCSSGCIAADCSCTAVEMYWTGMSSLVAPGSGWVVFFGTGGFGQGAPKTNSFAVRAVRNSP